MQRTQNASKAVALASALLLAVALLFSSFATAQQAYAVDASQQVTVQVQGNEDDAVTFTKADLEGLLEEGTLGYQYLKPTGDWFVVGAKDYIELSDLLDEAGVSDYWTQALRCSSPAPMATTISTSPPTRKPIALTSSMVKRVLRVLLRRRSNLRCLLCLPSRMLKSRSPVG